MTALHYAASLSDCLEIWSKTYQDLTWSKLHTSNFHGRSITKSATILKPQNSAWMPLRHGALVIVGGFLAKLPIRQSAIQKASELRRILHYLNALCMTHFNISVTCINMSSKRTIYSYKGCDSRQGAISQICAMSDPVNSHVRSKIQNTNIDLMTFVIG